MAEQKTRPTRASVESFLGKTPDDERREDCLTLLKLMKRVTKEKSRMWGPSMVGFGEYRYRYTSGREGDWFLAGFSPRKNDLTVYVMAGLERYASLLKKLGKHKTGKSCLYLERLADVDLKALEKIIDQSVKHMKKTHH